MRQLDLPLTVVLVLSSIGVSHANLWDRGQGLIYDDSLDITWLQNANLAASQVFGVSGIYPQGSMNPNTADAWIDALNDANYLGYSDWRLPSTDNQYGYGDIAGEMQHLYKSDLGNVPGAGYAQQGSDPVNVSFVDGNGKSVTFENVVDNSRYWYDEPYPPTPASTNSFSFYYGHQYAYVDTQSAYVWPVRDGDSSPIPAPGSALLVFIGLGCVEWVKKRLV